MFKKPETMTELSLAEKSMEGLNEFIANCDKLGEAFTVLDDKMQKAESRHQEFLSKAGEQEARRLLGELPDAQGKKLDTGIAVIKDEKERLDSAKRILENQAMSLDRETDAKLEQAGAILGALGRAVEAELEEELQAAARQINTLMNRLYAFYNATGIAKSKSSIFEMKIPSITQSRNLFEEPARFHPRHGDVVESKWRSDPEAMMLHERLKGMGVCYEKLRRMERDAYKRSKAA